MALNLETLQSNLAEAEIAYHKLSMGEVVVTTSNVDGGSATYNQTSMKRLQAYITDLEQKIAVVNGTARRGPIEFVL